MRTSSFDGIEFVGGGGMGNGIAAGTAIGAGIGASVGMSTGAGATAGGVAGGVIFGALTMSALVGLAAGSAFCNGPCMVYDLDASREFKELGAILD